jgi:hypothetical protein
MLVLTRVFTHVAKHVLHIFAGCEQSGDTVYSKHDDSKQTTHEPMGDDRIGCVAAGDAAL